MKIVLFKRLKLVSFLFLILLGCEQSQTNETTIDVGFRVFQTKDKSRIYKPGTDTTDYLYYRPLDIDVWYPAKISEGDSAMTFRNILGLLEERANYYTASHAADGLTSQFAQYFSDGFKCSDSSRLLNFRSVSFKDASPVDRKFPLVIYLASYNGMGYENFILFEELVKQGYVVVSINSIGRYPGDMTMKNEDMREQLHDAIASLKYLEGNGSMDFSRIGIIGYSWGGISAALLADKLPGAKCLISFDGSEFHHYGQAPEENNDFEGIRKSEDFTKMAINIPYLRLERSSLINEDKADSVFNFSEKLAGEKMILKIDSAQHEDFSSLPVVVRTSGDCRNNQVLPTITKLTIGFLDQHLKGSDEFQNLLNKEMHKTVQE